MTKHLKFSYLAKRLKNGAFHSEAQIAEAVKLIEQVRETHPEAFFELVKLCRFANYEASQQSRECLQAVNFLYKGEVKDIIKDIILSSVVGRSLQEMEVTCPLHDDASARLLCVNP